MAEEIPSSDSMKAYHDYLKDNYVGGCERFFSPTGFLQEFQRTVEVKAQTARNHVFVSTVDEAATKLEAAINTGADVFDLTAEPGTGKTSVLPFRFPSKKVIVALPTPFEAWNAYTMATGTASLRIKGLRLGPKDAQVVYTDSYLAAAALLSNYIEYDILIVDECDSDRGVSKFLAEVKTKGKMLIRMSASHGRNQAGLSKAFRVTESTVMPDIRQGAGPVATFVQEKHFGRSVLMAPDAASAGELAGLIRGAVLVSEGVRIDDMAVAMKNQQGEVLYVTDDTCGRSLNLNLDNVFDTQLVTEFTIVRLLTKAELYQRTNRVGRNRAGWYYCPGLPTCEKSTNDFDVTRHNVARAIAEIPQEGDTRLHVSLEVAKELMYSEIEPYEALMRRNVDEVAVMSPSSSGSSKDSFTSVVSKRKVRGVSVEVDEEGQKTITPPPWLAYYGGYSTRASDVGKKEIADTFIVSHAKGNKAFMRRKSSESSRDSSGSSGSYFNFGARSELVKSHGSPSLPVAKSAPYAVDRRSAQRYAPSLELPVAPPVMDLTMLTYDMDWPALIRDRLSRGGDLPTLVPPGSWRHTSAVGLGSDWFRRLDDLSVRDNAFDDSEFELVCRAWNKLVGQAWVKQSPGLSNVKDAHRIEYCVRYFQSYFTLGSVG